MIRSFTVLTVAFIAVATNVSADEKASPEAQWPSWRGPLGNGLAPQADPPIHWAEGKNIRWKTEIPGAGHSTPLIWGNRVFVTTAVPVGEPLPVKNPEPEGAHNNMAPRRKLDFIVLAIDRTSGKTIWQRSVRTEQPHEGTHETGTWASNSSVTDGAHIYAYFGSRGLYCLDQQGAVKWEADLGNMQTRHGHGEGSSPALHGDTLVINWDHQGDSYVVALDKSTGKQRWKVNRDEITSWSSPLVVEHGGKRQVIIAATNRVRGYDLANGQVIWECGGLSRNVVATPVAADGIVYVTNSYDTRAMLAIKLEGAHGDITDSQSVLWSRNRHTPYVPSPLLYDGLLYFLKHNQGFLTCLDAANGKSLFGPNRLSGIDRVFASPVGAAGRIYITARNGNTIVLKRGRQLEKLSVNRLSDSFSASPAIVGRSLFLRGERSLYCIEEKRGT